MKSAAWVSLLVVGVALAGCAEEAPKPQQPLAGDAGGADPLGLTAFAASPPSRTGPLRVVLQWTVPAADQCPTSTSVVQRQADGGGWTTLGIFHGPRGALSTDDADVQDNRTYTYRVTVTNCQAPAGAASTAKATVRVPGPPGAPEQLEEGGFVRLAWAPPEDLGGCGRIEGYRVYRALHDPAAEKAAKAKLAKAKTGLSTAAAADVDKVLHPPFVFVATVNPDPVAWPFAPELGPDAGAEAVTGFVDRDVPASRSYLHNYTVSAIGCAGEGPQGNASVAPPKPLVPVNTANEPGIGLLARPTSGKAWLATVNHYRAQAGLPPVVEDTKLSAADHLHALYMLGNDYIGHDEDPSLQGFTPEGAAAGQNSNVAGGTGKASPRRAVELWMIGPFHALGILDPRLQSVGFAYLFNGEAWRAALDVGSDLDAPVNETYPIAWPGHGAVVALKDYDGSETPDPLAPCAGYTAPTGLPILLQYPSAPEIVQTNLTVTGEDGPQELEHCVFDEGTYTNPDAAQEELGRKVLEAHHAVVIVPRKPLVPERTYTVSVENGDDRTVWTFRTS